MIIFPPSTPVNSEIEINGRRFKKNTVGWIATSPSVPYIPTPFNIVWDGNSWIAGSGSTGGLSFANQTMTLLQNAGKTTTHINYGIAGQTIIQMQSDAVTQVDSKASTYNILVGLELVNQWGLTTTYTKEQLLDQYKQYFLDRKSAGFTHVFACTPHGQSYYTRTSGGNWVDTRNWFASEMLATFPALGINVIDCGSDSRLLNSLDLTYFTADKIHLNNAGQLVQAEIASAKILSVVN